MKTNFKIGIVMTCALWCAGAAQAFAATAAVQCNKQAGGGTAHITISFHPQLSASITKGTHDVFIQIPEHLVMPNPEKVVKDCPGVIENIQTGFDTLLISLPRTAQFTVNNNPSGVTIALAASSTAAAAASTDEASSLAQARFFAASGDRRNAFNLLDQTLLQSPSSRAALLGLASAEAAVGLPRTSLNLMQNAFAITPPTPDESLLHDQVRSDIAPFAAFGNDYINGSGSFRENITEFQGRIPVSPGVDSSTMVNLAYQYNHARFSDLQGLDGTIGEVNPELNRYRVGIIQPLQNDDELWINADGVEQMFGGGAEFRSADRYGRWIVGGGLNQPDWNYASTVAELGTKSKVEFGREQFLLPRLSGRLMTSYNWYSLEHLSDAGESAGVRGGLEYSIRLQNPTITLAYRLDAEYFSTLTERVDQNGDTFRPLGTESREFHVLSLGLSQGFNAWPRADMTTSIGAFGGYAYDRLGDTAPELGANVSFKAPRGPEVRFEAGRTFSTVAQSSDQTRLIGRVIWRF